MWIRDRTLTENTGYTTVFEKEYTIQVVASEPEEPETPDVVIDQDKDVPQVSLGMDQAELAESLLTEEEINAGAQIVISVEKAELSEQQKELFQNAMSGYQEGVYLDISLFKVLNDQSAAITETKKPIRLTISIPEELRKDGRTFVIYRCLLYTSEPGCPQSPNRLRPRSETKCFPAGGKSVDTQKCQAPETAEKRSWRRFPQSG